MHLQMLNRKEERFEQHERGNGLLHFFHLLPLLRLTFNAIEPANHHSLFIILFHYIYHSFLNKILHLWFI